MRRKKTMSISEVLDEYKKEMQIEDKLKEVEIANSWKEIAGIAIARRTSRIYIKGAVLYIHTDSAVVRNELLMIKDTIRNRVNEIAGRELVESVVLR